MVDSPFKKCYTYDSDGSACGILYNGVRYYFNKNLQGDVISIINMAGTTLAKYTYDAWGKMLSVTDAQGTAITDPANIALINPYRYRGYYFDTESNLYYLQNRYYDPETGRFISPDNISYLDPQNFTGLNLYAYCGNNPVMYADPSGCVIVSFLIGMGVAALIGALVGATTNAVGQVINGIMTGNFEWSWGQFIGSAVGGAIGGAIAYIPIVGPLGAAGISGFFTNAGSMLFENIIDDTNYSALDILITSGISALLSMASFKYMDSVKIPGINSGRNSLKAISQQIFTKFHNGTIKNITWKTFVKMSGYDLYASLFGIFTNELNTRSGFRDLIIDLLP